MADSPSATSQFGSIDATNEIVMHLPFPDSEDPVLPQPYCAALLIWPLSVADFQALKRHSEKGNSSALNNLGTEA
jgi:hypothetical protein